ncbi:MULTISPECIES: hypothetical protein [Ramlibacter]|uniref:Uncharacterized protein n=1 Tax=Ramlibacter aquaticus TaxID=2780094 RepID=A0ABR9SIF9_9BURK|nr:MULTISPECIES: hypothetical protein [Ramlibacter]MBE7942156.1 hypothetical protein [Ramlibacter aquaticus]
MPYSVMYLRPRPNDSLWTALCSQPPRFLLVLGAWAFALLLLGGLDGLPWPALA